MKKLIIPMTIVLVFYLGVVAYEKDQASKAAAAEERAAAALKSLATVTNALGAKEREHANEDQEHKRMLKVLFPDSIAQIDKVFAPPVHAPAQPEAPAKAPETGDKK